MTKTKTISLKTPDKNSSKDIGDLKNVRFRQ